MYIVGALLILIILFLASCFFVLSFYEKQVLSRENILKEVLWKRRHKLPLLIELVTRNGLNFEASALIDMRNKASSGAYTFHEEIEFERKISAVLFGIFQEIGRQAPHKDTHLVSLQEEFTTMRESLEVALNDYNYEVEKLIKNLGKPWFKIFRFTLKTKQFTPLASM